MEPLQLYQYLPGATLGTRDDFRLVIENPFVFKESLFLNSLEFEDLRMRITNAWQERNAETLYRVTWQPSVLFSVARLMGNSRDGFKT